MYYVAGWTLDSLPSRPDEAGTCASWPAEVGKHVLAPAWDGRYASAPAGDERYERYASALAEVGTCDLL